MPRKRRGERLGTVAALVFARQGADLGGLGGEQRLGAPALDEGIEPRPTPALQFVGQAVVGAARVAARSAGSSMPAVVETSTSPLTRSGAASATCRATRPPSE